MKNQILDSIIIFLAGMLLFTLGLSSQEIIGFEARFYLFALEMWRHGPTWFPTTYQHPYPDYPAMSTYLIYLASALFGHLNKLTAVLPTAIASTLTLCVTYLIGARFGRRWGWCGVFFLLLTLTFVVEARTISLDQFVTLITVVCFLLLEKATRIRLGLIGALLILSFAFRGPIGIVIPTAVMCVSCLLDKNYKRFFVIGFSALFLLFFCSALLMLLAYIEGGVSFVQDVWRMEVASRLHDVKTLPYTFYFTECLGAYAITYPLVILVLVGSFTLPSSPQRKLLFKCIAWVAVILLGLSIPVDKKMRYVLAIAPALALICAFLYNNYKQNSYLHLVYKVMNALLLIFPLIIVMAVGVLYVKQVQLGLGYAVLFGLFSVLQVLAVLFRKTDIIVLGLAALSLYLANILIIEPINLNLNRTRDFVLKIESLRQSYQTPLVFFQEGSDGLPIKYLIDMPNEAKPIYLSQPAELLTIKQHTIVILSEENLSHIPANILKQFKDIQHGKIGHDDVIVLEKIQ